MWQVGVPLKSQILQSDFLSPSEHPKVTRSFGFRRTHTCKNLDPASVNFRPCFLFAASIFGKFILSLRSVIDVPSCHYNFPHIFLHSVCNLFLVLLILRNSAPLNVWEKRWSPSPWDTLTWNERTSFILSVSFHVHHVKIQQEQTSHFTDCTIHSLEWCPRMFCLWLRLSCKHHPSSRCLTQLSYWGPTFLLSTPLVMTTVCFMIAGSVAASDYPRRRHQAAQKCQRTSAKQIWWCLQRRLLICLDSDAACHCTPCTLLPTFHTASCFQYRSSPCTLA